MSDPLTHHLELVQLVVERLNSRQAFAFAFACVERQWPVYEQTSAGKPWSPAGLRSSIDQAWEELIDKKKMPGYLIERCQRSMPHDDLPSEPEVAAARLISHSAIDLLVALQENESDICHFPAARNFELLEMLDKEFEDKDFDCDTTSHVAQEIKKQKDDLVTLRISSNTSQIAAVREASRGRSLYGDLWFPE